MQIAWLEAKNKVVGSQMQPVAKKQSKRLLTVVVFERDLSTRRKKKKKRNRIAARATDD